MHYPLRRFEILTDSQQGAAVLVVLVAVGVAWNAAMPATATAQPAKAQQSGPFQLHAARLSAAQGDYNAAVSKLNQARGRLAQAENRIAERDQQSTAARANSDAATADLKEAELRIADGQPKQSEYQTAKQQLERAREYKKIAYDLAFQTDTYLEAEAKIKRSVDPGLKVPELRQRTLEESADYQRALDNMRQAEFRYNTIWNKLCEADAAWTDAAQRARELRFEEKRIKDQFGDLILQRNLERSTAIQASADAARAEAAIRAMKNNAPKAASTGGSQSKGKRGSRSKRKR